MIVAVRGVQIVCSHSNTVFCSNRVITTPVSSFTGCLVVIV